MSQGICGFVRTLFTGVIWMVNSIIRRLKNLEILVISYGGLGHFLAMYISHELS